MAVKVGRDESVAAAAAEIQDQSLEILQPPTTVFEHNGTKIEVKPFTFGNLLKALKHISNIATAFQGEDSTELNLLWAFANHAEDVVALCALSTALPVEFFDDIPSDLGVDVAVAVYNVNESFFTKTLLPKIQGSVPSDLPTETEEEAAPVATKTGGSKSSKS